MAVSQFLFGQTITQHTPSTICKIPKQIVVQQKHVQKPISCFFGLDVTLFYWPRLFSETDGLDWTSKAGVGHWDSLSDESVAQLTLCVSVTAFLQKQDFHTLQAQVVVPRLTEGAKHQQNMVILQTHLFEKCVLRQSGWTSSKYLKQSPSNFTNSRKHSSSKCVDMGIVIQEIFFTDFTKVAEPSPFYCQANQIPGGAVQACPK